MKKLYTLLAIAMLIAVANAAVFVYYPMTVNVSGTTAEVRFAPGSNAGGADLAGQTIAVALEGSYNTKATITIHPTNERTYYKNVLVIENYGVGRTYYGWINVKTAITNQYITAAYLHVKDADGNVVASIDLKWQEVQPTRLPITIPPATQITDESGNTVTIPGTLYIDIDIEIARNVDAGTVSTTAQLELIYSPQSAERP